MDLEVELAKERESYIRIETVVRQLAGQHLIKRGLSVVPTDSEVQGHLDACRAYYEIHGTKLGYDSPWIEAFNHPGHHSNVEVRGHGDGEAEKD